jgi:hypothetical protein
MNQDARVRLRFAGFMAMVKSGLCAIGAAWMWSISDGMWKEWLFWAIFVLVSLASITFFLIGMKIIERLKQTPEE